MRFLIALVLVAAWDGCALAQGVAAFPRRQRPATFPHTKPVLGLPDGVARPPVACSSDGLSYYTAASGAAEGGALDVYSVSSSAEVKRFRRMAPQDAGAVTIRDFFPADHRLVTLLEADQPNDRDAAGPPREVRYFLSTSDHEGDGATLLPVALGFTPFRVAAFPTGEFLALGWDEANLLPELAVLKEDGTVRRFVDVEERPSGSAARAVATGDAGAREALTRAVFVPFGNDILLTYPGTARPMRMLSVARQDRTLALTFPGGWVLHDVMVSGGGSTLIARLQESTEEGGTEEKKRRLREKIFEFSAGDGGALWEYTFDKQKAEDVTCAAGYTLTAVFREKIGSVAVPAAGFVAGDEATQMVVGTSRR